MSEENLMVWLTIDTCSAGGWCFIEDRERTGQDYWRNPTDLCDSGNPEFDADICFEPDFDQTIIEPNDRRLTSLYDRDEVCTDAGIGSEILTTIRSVAIVS